jgi:hypothetical protein
LVSSNLVLPPSELRAPAVFPRQAWWSHQQGQKEEVLEVVAVEVEPVLEPLFAVQYQQYLLAPWSEARFRQSRAR